MTGSIFQNIFKYKKSNFFFLPLNKINISITLIKHFGVKILAKFEIFNLDEITSLVTDKASTSKLLNYKTRTYSVFEKFVGQHVEKL